jgi:ABC-2 type transport system ATP-binding protein
MEEPAQLLNVTKRYANALALDDVSLSISKGELVALLGPNGAGKTTAVKLLLGLAPATSGTARVFGLDPRHAANRARTGAMLQVGKVPESLRVREHIALFSTYYPRPLPLRDVIDAAGLAGLENRIFGELSGGQKQRVLFALAICGDPDLLVLDEPTVGLDVEVRRAIWEQIRSFVGRGRSILLTTHSLGEADALADRIVVIDHGRLVAEGTPGEIKSRTAGKRIRCTTSLSLAAIERLAGVTSVVRERAATEIMTANSDATVRALLALDASLANLEVSSAGLEEAFLALTQSKEVA